MSGPPPQPSPLHPPAQVFLCVAICPGDLSFLQSEIPPKEAIGSLPNPWYLSPSPQGQAQFHGLFLFLTSPKKASPGLQNGQRPKGKVLEEIPGVMWRCIQHLQENWVPRDPYSPQRLCPGPGGTLVLLRREQREGRTTLGGGWAPVGQAELEGALGCQQGCVRC